MLRRKATSTCEAGDDVKRSAVCMFGALLAIALAAAPGSARVDCANPSDTCSPNEIHYLQFLQSTDIDVSGKQAATDIGPLVPPHEMTFACSYAHGSGDGLP